jgi:RNA polymerase sigma-70 factor, ECF subfamily
VDVIALAALMSGADESQAAASFETVALRERHRLFILAVSILRDRGEAEDAVQETLVRAWKAWPNLRNTDHLSAWLTRVCVNHCISRRRSLMSRGWLWRREPEKSTAVTAPGSNAELVDFDRIYARLSVRQRAALTLNYRHGYSIDECAVLMRCRPGTVRSHLARALAILRREMSDD